MTDWTIYEPLFYFNHIGHYYNEIPMLQFLVLTARDEAYTSKLFTQTEHTSMMLLVCAGLLANWR